MKSKHLVKAEKIAKRQKEFNKQLDNVEMCLGALERANNVDDIITVEFNSDEMHTLLNCLIDYMELLKTTATQDVCEMLKLNPDDES